LAIAYALEKNAIHPIAKAIVREAQKKNVPIIELNGFRSVPGYGLEAFLNDQPIYIGNPEYILSKLPQQDEIKQKISSLQKEGELIAILLVGDKLYLFRFQDTLRPHIKETLSQLKSLYNLKQVMLTGDHADNAKSIASQIGMDTYYADLKPEDKLDHVTNLAQTQGLAMVGDGINDAPALARATVGICMGQVGNTTAVEAADIILLNDNIETLPWLFNIANKTQSIVKQNLTLATVAIIVASLPALGGLVPLWLAVIMHEGGTVLVGLNALRLLKK
jgi:P-type E1-E2 ATPase